MGSQISWIYRQIEHVDLVLTLTRRLLKDVHIDLNNKDIIVACCGYGADIVSLKKHYKARLSAFDINEEYVEYVAGKHPEVDVNKENLDYTLANYLDLRSDSLVGPLKPSQSVDSTGKVWLLTRSQF